MKQLIVITAERGRFWLNIREIFAYRELIVFLAWRDIMAQYKQAFFGVAWAVVRPVFAVGVYSLVFGKVAGLSSGGMPYPLFALCGITAWNLFASSLEQSTVSLLANTNLVTKVYFPRQIVPLASLGRGLVDFLIASALLVLLMLLYRQPPSGTIIFLPLFMAAGMILILGLGFFASALCAKYHDVKMAVPFLLQMWFWITPVAYGLENIPENLRLLFYLNPMTWIIEGFRWSILGTGEQDLFRTLMTCLMASGVFIAGYVYFHFSERELADII